MNWTAVFFWSFVIASVAALRWRALRESAEASREQIRIWWQQEQQGRTKIEKKYDDLLSSQRRDRNGELAYRDKLEGEVRQLKAEILAEREVWRRQVDELRRELIETQDFAIRAARAVIEKSL